jgi:hypothetical protein
MKFDWLKIFRKSSQVRRYSLVSMAKSRLLKMSIFQGIDNEKLLLLVRQIV